MSAAFYLLTMTLLLVMDWSCFPNSQVHALQTAHSYSRLLQKAQSCVQESHGKFLSGDDYYSNPKPQMGTWVAQEQLEPVQQLLSTMNLNASSSISQWLLHSPSPTMQALFESSLLSVSVLHAPPRHSLYPRCHQAGTVLLYKCLHGTGALVSSVGGRPFQTDALHAAAHTSMRRVGGPYRSLCAAADSSCTVLEIALHPPKYSAGEVELASEPVVSPLYDPEHRSITLSVPEEAKPSLFADPSLSSSPSSPSSSSLTLLPGPLSASASASASLSVAGELERLRGRLSGQVGGLGGEVEKILRRLLSLRLLSPQLQQNLGGLGQVRGLLLYGPPGTGKTLLARELAAGLGAKEIRYVNGPEILDKFIGEAERNIRDLFAKAEEDLALNKEQAGLHVIIFDEIDAIAKKRGLGGGMVGDTTGVRDSCVNQLLTMLDGLVQRPNVLVIGLTNRKELLDPALLRPGRLEVQLEIPAPRLAGREEILAILCRPLVQERLLPADLCLDLLTHYAKKTSGWTGADLGGLVRAALSHGLHRAHSNNNLSLSAEDFALAYEEVAGTVLMNSPIVKKKASKREMVKTMLRKVWKKGGFFPWGEKALEEGAEKKMKLMELLFRPVLPPVLAGNSTLF